ncbi:Uncharacterised protein [Mycobacteroides abscessus subsp. abscessus]|nr:Uncharacterised protein [Mycobacteroides abscessus subsp. abscessus]
MRANTIAAGPLAGALKNLSCLRHGMPPPYCGIQASRNCCRKRFSARGRSRPNSSEARCMASANHAISS